MKKYSIAVLTLVCFVCLSLTKSNFEPLKIGQKAPLVSEKLMDVSDKSYSLTDLKKKNGLLVIFSCNTCPFVIEWQSRYNELKDFCDKNDMGMVLVNSNEAKRDKDDSLEKMKAHAAKNEYKSFYVVDADSKLANAFGAKTTPHIYLFDKNMKLAYRGSIDNRYEIKDSKKYDKEYLLDAISALSKSEKIKVSETNSKGCSIKRVVITE